MTYVWGDKGSRPPAPRDCRYSWAYIFGAVCPARDTGVALVLPYADKQAMTLHLAEISRAVAPGAHAVVIVDGAGWHKPGGRLRQPDNISMLVLPPYSPELNPQENIWQFLRELPAVCPARDTGVALVLPYADKQAMTLHLAEISRAVAPGAHAVVIVDGAGWHKPGGRLRQPDNISMLVLPPYSPELNPQENIWQFLRQNYLSNRVFATYSAIVDACCAAWNALVGQSGTITSIASREWAQTVIV